MLANYTRPCHQPKSRHRTFLAIPLESLPGHPQPSKKNHHLTSNLSDLNLKFLKKKSEFVIFINQEICISADFFLKNPFFQEATKEAIPAHFIICRHIQLFPHCSLYTNEGMEISQN